MAATTRSTTSTCIEDVVKLRTNIGNNYNPFWTWVTGDYTDMGYSKLRLVRSAVRCEMSLT